MIKNKYINNNYLMSEEENKTKKIEDFIEDILRRIQQISNANPFSRKDVFRAMKILNEFLVHNEFPKIEYLFRLNTSYQDYIRVLESYLTKLIENEEVDYTVYFKKPKYQLSDNEHDTIQDLINKLRDKVTSEDRLDTKHKDRILKKLNEMQSEVNKSMSSFDAFIGKTHDIFKVLRYGRKEVVSPLLKETTDLVKAVNKIESKHSGLPDASNQIEHDDILEVEVYEKTQLEDISQ